MQLMIKKTAMDKPLLTEEQMDQVLRFKFTMELLERDYPVSDVFIKLSDKLPNNYDLGAVVRDVMVNLKPTKTV
jgi:hypothetical protein